jgi:LysR family hydrogen peroxide-inducible transcriptional activator
MQPNVNLPTLKQLRHLVGLAEHGHFGRAAEALAVTQSTLSASLKELEGILGAALVDRTRRRVVFTPLGRETVERARRLLEDAEALTRAAAASRAPLTGTIRLGVIPTIGPFLLPPVLPALRRAYPALKLYLREDLTDRLLAQLQEGSLDLLLLALPYDCGGAETAPLFDDRFAAALPGDHPLAGERAVTPAALEGEPLLLLQDGHCLRDHALSACGLGAPRHADEFAGTSLPTLVQMVDNGLGVTLLPELALSTGILAGTGVVTRPLAAAAPVRQIGLAWRRGTARAAEFALLGREIERLWKKRLERRRPTAGNA